MSRIATVVAVGFLLLDGVLLLLAASGTRDPRLGFGGAVCLAAAAGVLWFWRRYRRNLARLAAQRREVQAEARAIRDLLRR